MDKPNSKGRILAILQLLKEKSDEEHPVTTAEIILYLKDRGYSVTGKTLKDDISVLQDFGYDVILSNHQANEYFLGERSLQTTEIKLLTDAIASSRALSAQKSQELIDKILTLTSDYQKEYLSPIIGVDDRTKPTDNKIYYALDNIMTAMKEHKQISYYMCDYNLAKEPVLKNDSEMYVLSPYACIWNDDAYYVIGYSQKHKKIISPRLDRIHDVHILPEMSCPKPEKFDLSDFSGRIFKMYDGNMQTVELICDNSLVKNVIDRFGRDFELEPVSNSRFKATVKVSVSKTFFAWVFQFVGEMVISGPEAVTKKYKSMLENVIRSEEE